MKDITGQKFNRLTAIRFVGKLRKSDNYWEFRCDCGNTIIVPDYSARSGNTKSCGCLQKEIAGARFRTHGQRFTRLYRIWQGVLRRCYTSTNPSYKYYGGRGIIVQESWRTNFLNFKEWAEAHGYRNDLTIERIDVNGNYTEDNCTWIPQSEQLKNRRHKVSKYSGERTDFIKLKEQTGVSKEVIRRRMNECGLSFEEACAIPVTLKKKQMKKRTSKYLPDGSDLRDLAESAGLTTNQLVTRLRAGWTLERALSEPVHNNGLGKNRKKKNG